MKQSALYYLNSFKLSASFRAFLSKFSKCRVDGISGEETETGSEDLMHVELFEQCCQSTRFTNFWHRLFSHRIIEKNQHIYIHLIVFDTKKKAHRFSLIFFSAAAQCKFDFLKPKSIMNKVKADFTIGFFFVLYIDCHNKAIFN